MTTPTRAALVEAMTKMIIRFEIEAMGFAIGTLYAVVDNEKTGAERVVKSFGKRNEAEKALAVFQGIAAFAALSAFAKEHGLKLLGRDDIYCTYAAFAAAPSFPWDGGQSKESKDG